MIRVGVVGCGFWARYQIAAWQEVPGVGVIALTSLVRADAEAVPGNYSIYESASDLAASGTVDLIDIIASAQSHRKIVEELAQFKVPIICQKPMAESLPDCRAMVEACEREGTWFAIHENWRYQAPFLELHRRLVAHEIGTVFRARLSFCCSFPVYTNQPALARARRFILSDVGSHVLDVVRHLFGEALRVTCLTQRINPDIAGEDVATVLIETDKGVTVTVELSYASPLEREKFPETRALVEGTLGSICLERDSELRIYRNEAVEVLQVSSPHYKWANPEYALVHASIVQCHTALVEACQNQVSAPTSGQDNLKTMALLEACYASAERRRTIEMSEFV